MKLKSCGVIMTAHKDISITHKTGALSYTLLLTTFLVVFVGPLAPVHASYNFIRCGECDEARCPELHYCEGDPIKDHCGCCTICSSSKFQPHLMIAQQPAGNACDQVQCPKLKVCVENMQGLPLCTCPSMFVCRRTKKREVCGTDGQTYESRCHMRIASCNQGVTVRKKYRGACTEEDEEKDGASYRRRLKKMKKRRRRRRRKQENDPDSDKNEKRVKRRRKDRRRKRRKSGLKKNRQKSRVRRHRRRSHLHNAGKAFEEAFAHYTWKA